MKDKELGNTVNDNNNNNSDEIKIPAEMQHAIQRYHDYVNAEDRHAKSPVILFEDGIANSCLLELIFDQDNLDYLSELSKTYMSKFTSRIRDDHHRSMAHIQALAGNFEQLAELADQRRSCLHDLDADGMTPLHYLVFSPASTDDIKEFVWKYQLDTGACNKFHQIAESEIEKNFLISSVLNTYIYGDGATKLHDAISLQKLDKVKELVEAGANINAINNHGDTPLHLAVKFSPWFNKNAKQNNQHNEHPLTAKEAIANIVDQEGLAIVEYLVKQQADRHHRNVDGKKPQELAKKKSPAYNMIDWKESRHQQKYNPFYVNKNIDRDVNLDDYWVDSMAETEASIVKMQFHINTKSDALARLAKAALHAFKRELTQNYIGDYKAAVSFLSWLQKAISHHDETFNSLIADLATCDMVRFDSPPLAPNIIPVDNNEDFAPPNQLIDLQNNFKKAPHHTLLGLLKGDNGAIKQVKLTTLQKSINTNGKLMGLFSHCEKQLRKAIETEAVYENDNGPLFG